jgi:hypothetical protein
MEIDLRVSVEVDGITAYAEAVELAVLAVTAALEDLHQVDLPSGSITLTDVEEG